MHNESSEDVANQKSKNIFDLSYDFVDKSGWVYVCVSVSVCVCCCYLLQVSNARSLNCQWDLHINKKKAN